VYHYLDLAPYGASRVLQGTQSHMERAESYRNPVLVFFTRRTRYYPVLWNCSNGLEMEPSPYGDESYVDHMVPTCA